MIKLLSSKKTLLGTTMGFIAFLVIGGLFTSTRINTTEDKVNTNPGKVFSRDIYDRRYNLSAVEIEFIENTLYTHVKDSELGLYTATIRPDSHTKRVTSNTPPIIVTENFLIDVEPSQQTYLVSTTSQQAGLIEIVCAPRDMQLNKDTSCSSGSVYW